MVNSTLGANEREQVFDQLEHGCLEFLFLAPEQLTREETLDQLRAAQPSLFVVDEAHCIAEWGHDFRPDYLKLGSVIEALGHPRVLALTSTASPPVRQEIIERLEMPSPQVIVRGLDRPNIRLAVETYYDEASKEQALLGGRVNYYYPPFGANTASSQQGHRTSIQVMQYMAGSVRINKGVFFPGGNCKVLGVRFGCKFAPEEHLCSPPF